MAFDNALNILFDFLKSQFFFENIKIYASNHNLSISHFLISTKIISGLKSTNQGVFREINLIFMSN